MNVAWGGWGRWGGRVRRRGGNWPQALSPGRFPPLPGGPSSRSCQGHMAITKLKGWPLVSGRTQVLLRDISFPKAKRRRRWNCAVNDAIQSKAQTKCARSPGCSDISVVTISPPLRHLGNIIPTWDPFSPPGPQEPSPQSSSLLTVSVPRARAGTAAPRRRREVGRDGGPAPAIPIRSCRKTLPF